MTQSGDACACVRGGLTSLRRDAQQVCLIFHTTAATRSSDRKQLERKRVNVNVDSPPNVGTRGGQTTKREEAS